MWGRCVGVLSRPWRPSPTFRERIVDLTPSFLHPCPGFEGRVNRSGQRQSLRALSFHPVKPYTVPIKVVGVDMISKRVSDGPTSVSEGRPTPYVDDGDPESRVYPRPLHVSPETSRSVGRQSHPALSSGRHRQEKGLVALVLSTLDVCGKVTGRCHTGGSDTHPVTPSSLVRSPFP